MRVVVIALLLIIEIPFAIATTLLAVRLLGTRRSWVATTLAGAIGWVGGNLLQVALNHWDWDAARLSVGTVSLSVVFTMLAAVSLDFLARPGTLARGEGAGLLVLPSPIRDLRRRLAPYARYRQIIAIARRNGLALPGVGRRRTAERVPVDVALRTTLEQCGVVFVKLGGGISPGYALVDGMSRLYERGMPAVEPGTSMQDRLAHGLVAELPRLQRLPSQIDRIASLAGRGELRTRIALFSTEQDARVITTLVNRLVLGLGGALLFIGSTLLLMVSDNPSSSLNTSLTRTFGYVGLALAATLLLRVVAAIVREGYN